VDEAEIELPGTPSSVSEARRFVHAVLDSGGAGDEAWVVTQVVSELATNAVVHAGTSFVLNIAYDDAQIRVSVTDAKPLARATVRHFSNENTTGRGLRLVQSLSRSWGVDQTKAAKTVWCELRRGAAALVEADDFSDETLSVFFPDEAGPAHVRGVENAVASHSAVA
jgi:anti-sigma regulatory factor (Ser/Thr protein kinase)